jgi:RimJ/RimL family protein N-acetyltransferase
VGDTVLETPRLVLRHWRPKDREPFAQLNADPGVMRYLPATLSRPQSDAMADRIERTLSTRGWGLYAAEIHETEAFIGFIGLAVPGTASPRAMRRDRLAAGCGALEPRPRDRGSAHGGRLRLRGASSARTRSLYGRA